MAALESAVVFFELIGAVGSVCGFVGGVAMLIDAAIKLRSRK